MVCLQQKGIEVSSFELGMIFIGVDIMVSYEEVLYLLCYWNWYVRFLFDWKFKFICLELNGCYISNEFKVEVNVIYMVNFMEYVNYMVVQLQFVYLEYCFFVDLLGYNLVNFYLFVVVFSIVIVVIVVCVSFLVFMIILGVFWIWVVYWWIMWDQDIGKENEMDWDDFVLIIIVNFMEIYEDQYSSEEEEEEEEEEESEDGEEEDDIISVELESSEEEEGEQGDFQNVIWQQQLEWDDFIFSY